VARASDLRSRDAGSTPGRCIAGWPSSTQPSIPSEHRRSDGDYTGVIYPPNIGPGKILWSNNEARTVVNLFHNSI